MEDPNKDYLTLYRQFFENFASTVDFSDQLPVKVASYNVAESEIPGEIIDWCLQYLNQRNCPHSLIVPLCRKVLEEIIQVCKKHPDFCGYRTEEDDFHTLRLMQAATRKLVEVCIRYTDNALLCTLPAPPPPGSLVAPPVSAYAIKNARRTMEDRHVAIQDLHALFNIKDCGSASYYGVFDGHNGADAAIYCVSHLHQYLAESSYYPANPELALKDAFRKTDDRFNNKSDKENLRSGTTAVCALLRPKESMLYVAWIGDSQAVLVNQGQPYQLVKPHKPDQPEERERIEEMGGSVLYWGTWRVNGLLAVSRAIGDIEYKPYVSGEPDVRVIPLTGQEDFLVLACDGLWDFMTEQEVTDTIYEYLAKHPDDIEGVSKRLAQVGKTQGSTDNISVLVVFLKEQGGNKNSVNTSGSTSLSTSTSSSGVGVGGGMDVFPDIYVKQNGRAGMVSGGGVGPVTGTGQETGPGYDEDDFGPETDVDSVDDVLLSPSIAAAKAMAAHSPVPGLGGQVWVPRGKLHHQQESWLKTLPWSYADALRNPPPPKNKTSEVDASHRLQPRVHRPSTPPAEEVSNDVVGEGEGESGDDSEEEWNYIRGEEKEVDKKNEEEQEDDSDMESRLNPNAAEFVPGVPVDPVLASSPPPSINEKSLEDIIAPLKDFYTEGEEKPSQIEPLCDKIDTSIQDASLNGGDETEILSTKAEFGDESAYSLSMSMHTSIAFLADEENKEMSDTNPFIKTTDQQDSFENEFIKDHFASPTMDSNKEKPEEPSKQTPEEEEEGTTVFFKIPQELERNLLLESNSAETMVCPLNRPLSPLEDLDSPYDFMSNTDKSDALSPIDLPERQTIANQEPTSSSGFDSESNEEIDSNMQEKLVDSIAISEEIDTDEVIRSKPDMDTPAKETDSFMTESLIEVATHESDDHVREEEFLEEEKAINQNVLSVITTSTVLSTVESVEEPALEPCIESEPCVKPVPGVEPELCIDLNTPSVESSKKTEEDEESTVPLDSPVNELLSPSKEHLQESVKVVSPLPIEEESMSEMKELNIMETHLPEKGIETQQTVDFIQELHFNGGVILKEEDDASLSLHHSNENTIESEIEAGFEIISHETASELQIEELKLESESVKELSSTDENEFHKISDQNVMIGKTSEEINLSHSDILKNDDLIEKDELANLSIPTNESVVSHMVVEDESNLRTIEASEMKGSEFEEISKEITIGVSIEERITVDTTEKVEIAVEKELLIEPEKPKENETGNTLDDTPINEDKLVKATIDEIREEIITSNIQNEVFEIEEKIVAVKDVTLSEKEIATTNEVEEVMKSEANDKDKIFVDVLEKPEAHQDIDFSLEACKENKPEGISYSNESEMKEVVKLGEMEDLENKTPESKEEILQIEDFAEERTLPIEDLIEEETHEKMIHDLSTLDNNMKQLKEDEILENTVNDEDKIVETTEIIIENVEIPVKTDDSFKFEEIEDSVTEGKMEMQDITEVKLEEINKNLTIDEEINKNLTIDEEINKNLTIDKEINKNLTIDKEIVKQETLDLTSEIIAMEAETKKSDIGIEETIKPGSLEIEVNKPTPLELSSGGSSAPIAPDAIPAATPPSTPAPGITEDNTKGLIAAAIAAAATTTGAVTVAASSEASAIAAEKLESKKSSTAASPKKAAPTKVGAKPTAPVKSPTKTGPGTLTGVTKKVSPTSGAKQPTKPGTLGTKPTTPTGKPSTPLGTKATSATTPSKAPSKPGTPVSKAPVKNSTKPTTPTTISLAKSKPAESSPPKPAAPSKPKTPATSAKPSADKPTVKEAPKKPTATAPKPPTASSKTAAGAAPTKAAAPPKAVTKAPTGPPKAKAAATSGPGPTTKRVPAKPPTPSSTSAPKAPAKAPSRPTSAKPASCGTVKPAASTTTKAAPLKPSVKPAVTKAPAPAPGGPKPTAPAAPKPKAPVPAKTKQPVPGKKPASTDKSVKDAANNKLSSAKSQVKKDIIEDKERQLLGDEPATQEHIVTTTNGHVDIIENGIGNGEDSPVEKLHPEIAVSLD